MKRCKACGLEINTKTERYTHLEDWDGRKIENDSWWHLTCFKKAMNRELTQMEKKAQQLLGRAESVFHKLPAELKEEEYTLC